jgi:hypothetical protein
MGKKEEKKKEVVEETKALLEMYQAGFLDGYKKNNKLKTDEDWALMNKQYKLSFYKRFGKKINKELKKKK